MSDVIISQFDLVSENGIKFSIELLDDGWGFFFSIVHYHISENRFCRYDRYIEEGKIDWDKEQKRGNYYTPLEIRAQIDKVLKLGAFW